MPKDVDTLSAASDGSREPVAWAVYLNGFYGVTVCGSYPRESVAAGHEVVPLYRIPQPALTDEEREAIWTVAEAYAENDDDPECQRIAGIMQGLWQRTR